MRHALPLVAAVAALVLTGCTNLTVIRTDGAPNTTTAKTPASAEVPVKFHDANSQAPWFHKVKAVSVDGKGVLVRTMLDKGDTATALAMCEAAYQAARTAGADFVSVTVRSSGDSSIASRNELRKDAACS
ncbi:hypothetical protein BC739_008039 [Kutzneria viridogrisea]|uniref:Secreted protein n=2 Tax=Kutzneria TaxID=43356 RepID=W5W968_9PSEU|nr:hypothetical protein [Kutzneria albida]AHH97290.1 hypothetical protein KALB_3926 [Kutzneria albida DSM 43870]MBA8930792.1 hypothetical protein [Kutzneria viridogrisea]